MVFLHSNGVGTARAVRISQDLWRGRGAGYDREPLSASPGHPRDRLQERRRDRNEALHRKDRNDPACAPAYRYALTEAMDEGHCGLPTDQLIPLAEELLEAPRELILTALELERSEASSLPTRSATRLHFPGGPLQGGTSDRRSADPHRKRQAALAMDRRREGPPLGRKAQRFAAC